MRGANDAALVLTEFVGFNHAHHDWARCDQVLQLLGESIDGNRTDVADRAEFAVQANEDVAGVGAIRGLLAPGGDLKRQQHAGYDDHEFQDDREPVLLAHGAAEARENHAMDTASIRLALINSIPEAGPSCSFSAREMLSSIIERSAFEPQSACARPVGNPVSASHFARMT